MSDTYGSMPIGGSMSDLVSIQRGGVQNLGVLAATLATAFPAALASAILNVLAGPAGTASPQFTGASLGTAGASVIGSSSTRRAIVFHNPGDSVAVYVYPSIGTPTPTLATTGGALKIAAGSTLEFGPVAYANVNAAFSAFAGTGTANPLTVWEFF